MGARRGVARELVRPHLTLVASRDCCGGCVHFDRTLADAPFGVCRVRRLTLENVTRAVVRESHVCPDWSGR